MQRVIILSLLLVTIFAGADYDYTDPNTDWANKGDCGGDAQSPINIVTNDATCVNGLTITPSFSGSQTSAELHIPNTLINSSTGIRDLKQNAAVSQNIGTFTVSDPQAPSTTHDYTASQFHIHTPSEHTINGNAFDAELHIVFTIDSGSTTSSRTAAVLGLFFEETSGASDTILGKWGVESASDPMSINPSDIFDAVDTSEDMIVYEGSLTTPPCSEIVTFYLVKEAFPATAAEITALTDLITDTSVYGNPQKNARPTQSLNGRTVWINQSDKCPKNTDDSAQIISYSALVLGLFVALLF